MKNPLKVIAVVALSILFQSASAQRELLQSGPMVGYSTMKEVQLWVQTTATAKVQFAYWDEDRPQKKYTTDEVISEKDKAFVVKLMADEVQPGKTYAYELLINGKNITRPYRLQFQTQTLWHGREEPPEISFVTGSCVYVNEPDHDRPGKGYGADYGIFDNMLKEKPDFMLWLGDNTYLRPPDWNSRTGIYHRYTHTRSLPEMQALLGSVHHYAIWDDHDYGPNDADRGFWNKDITEETFNLFWSNPNTNLTGKGGITGTFVWGDVQFFLLDDRTFRSPNGQKVGKKELLGEAQLAWLKDAITFSRATFKIIAIGGQVLNTAAIHENYANYPEERERLLRIIQESEASGVLFLTGDRHHTEMSTLEQEGSYPLHDLTISPLTSGVHDPGDEGNKLLVEGTVVGDKRNYAVIKVTGPLADRKMTVQVKSAKGKLLWDKEIVAKDLK